MINKTKLDCKYPVGNGVSTPEFASASNTIPTKSVPVSGGDSIPTGASNENLSAKFKNPRVKQDVPEAGRNQFE